MATKSAKRKPVMQESSVETVMEESVAVSTVNTPAQAVAPVVFEHKELSPDLYVPCVSLVRVGKLVYSSRRQVGYEVVWRGFMDVQYIELKELMSMRSSDVTFFSENWIAIEDSFEYKDEVMKKLRITDMYKNISDTGEFSRLLVLPIEQMVSRIAGMSKTIKESVASYAKECIANGDLDSLKRIKALEDALGTKLS